MKNSGWDEPGVGFTNACSLGIAMALGAAMLGASERAAVAALPSEYTLVGTTTLPSGMWDIAPDGRIVGLEGNTIVRQTSIGGASYAPIGSIAPGTISAFGASFLAISPGGTNIAIGDNEFGSAARVHVVGVSDLSTSGPTMTTSVQSLNYAGAWSSEAELYVSGGVFGGANGVRRITLAGGGAGALEEIHGIPEAAGGVGVNTGRVFAGVGFGARTGEVRSFDVASLIGSPGATSFDSGLLHGTFLSAGGIDFDDSSNLIVAGQSGVFITDLAGNQVILSPFGHGAYYNAAFNPFTREIVVQATDFVSGGTGVFVYGVPAPASVGVLMIGAGALRRRRSKA